MELGNRYYFVLKAIMPLMPKKRYIYVYIYIYIYIFIYFIDMQESKLIQVMLRF